MAQPSWTTDSIASPRAKSKAPYLVLGGVIFVVIAFLIATVIRQNGEYFLTIPEYNEKAASYSERDVRLSGWVIGDSIVYEQIDKYESKIEFDIVEGYEDLSNPVHVVVYNEPMPDLLHHESQALVTGRVDENGVLMVNPGGLLLKCPSRYEGTGVDGVAVDSGQIDESYE